LGKGGASRFNGQDDVKRCRTKSRIIVCSVPLLLQIDDGVRERNQVGIETAGRLVFAVLGWKGRLDDVFTKSSQWCVIDAAIHQFVSRCVTMRLANEIVGDLSRDGVEDGVVCI
jgi:hypothetical protein